VNAYSRLENTVTTILPWEFIIAHLWNGISQLITKFNALLSPQLACCSYYCASFVCNLFFQVTNTPSNWDGVGYYPHIYIMLCFLWLCSSKDPVQGH
jgi:hypothetical protein